MLSYASGISDLPLLGETIGENFERTVARFGDREALVDVAAGSRWTYAELDAAVNRVALGLMARGI
jgi:fatty-acyl-CoA synthase